MPTITLDVSDEVAAYIDSMRDRVPELLARSLQQQPIPADVYRYVLDFLASDPTPQAIAAFGPTPEMRERIQFLVERSVAGTIHVTEAAELDEYERIEHLMILIKSRNLSMLKA